MASQLTHPQWKRFKLWCLRQRGTPTKIGFDTWLRNMSGVEETSAQKYSRLVRMDMQKREEEAKQNRLRDEIQNQKVKVLIDDLVRQMKI